MHIRLKIHSAKKELQNCNKNKTKVKQIKIHSHIAQESKTKHNKSLHGSLHLERKLYYYKKRIIFLSL